MVVSEEEAGVLLPIEIEGAALEGQQGPRREATRRSTSDDRALIIGIGPLVVRVVCRWWGVWAVSSSVRAVQGKRRERGAQLILPLPLVVD